MWWSNLFSDMSSASFFNFSFLPKYAAFFIQCIEYTLLLAVVSVLLAVLPALLLALMRLSKNGLIRGLSGAYIAVFRSTPLLVQLFVVFYGLRAGYYMSSFWAAVLVFSINEGAYCAETMRGALEAVPVGQIEAGYCVGMSYTQIMRRIVLPQALRTAFPPLSNSLISMVKDTSLASNITVAEMFMATQRINARYYEPLALYLEVAVIYLIFCTLLTWLQRLGEKKLSAYTKKEARHA